MDKEKSIAVLNTLIEINNDRIAGYETAADETQEADLQSMFSQFIKTSRRFKEELVTEVQKLGGAPTQETKTEGKVFRAWMGFKTVLTAHHSRSILLFSCEIGEEVVVDAYSNALSYHGKNLSAEQQIIISAQYATITDEYGQIKGRRDMLVEQK